jgi:hypothetical protein
MSNVRPLMSESKPPSTREFYEFAVDRFAFEYDQLLESWKQIDSKAQATATIGGVFLAATLVFVRTSTLGLSKPQAIAIGLTATCLVLTIGLAVVAMLVRQAFLPMSGAQAATIVSHVLTQPSAEAEVRYNGMLADTIDSWGPVNTQLREGLTVKTSRLEMAQKLLLVSSAGVLFTAAVALI